MWAVMSVGIVDILTTCRAVDWSGSRRADKSGYEAKLLDEQCVSLMRNNWAELRRTPRAERVEWDWESFPTVLAGRCSFCTVPDRERQWRRRTKQRCEGCG